jgi:hypothetical protein
MIEKVGDTGPGVFRSTLPIVSSPNDEGSVGNDAVLILNESVKVELAPAGLEVLFFPEHMSLYISGDERL